jgi:hypothetical protein
MVDWRVSTAPGALPLVNELIPSRDTMCETSLAPS